MRLTTSVAGSHVLITGGASGLGAIMARLCLERGARVTLWDVNDEMLTQTVADLRQSTGANQQELRGRLVDISSFSQVKTHAGETGPVDIIINSAGVVNGKTLLEASDEEITRTFNVNVLALYWTAKAFLPGMLRRDRGCIVTLASAAGLVGVAKQTDYSASKFAAVGFTESLRQELAKRASSVNTLIVCPYYIETGMFDGVKTRFPHLLPVLQPEAVSRAVVEGIERGKQQLMMPPLVHALPLLRLLPTYAFDKVLTLFGINDTMNEFRGRR